MWETIGNLLGQALVVAVILGLIALAIGPTLRWSHARGASSALPRATKRHFGRAFGEVAITERRFPSQIRVEIQRAIDEYLADATVDLFTGLKSPYHQKVDFGAIFQEDPSYPMSVAAAPPTYEEIDVGEESPARSLENAVWLASRGGLRFAVLYVYGDPDGYSGVKKVRVQFAAAAGTESERAAEEFFRRIELAVQHARVYRGKVLSLEGGSEYSGQTTAVKVHRLGRVSRDQVILPRKTLDLLDRNVAEFVKSRAGLKRFGMAAKKGLLFYGPPGTGKTHTIRYLAATLSGHTTLLISAEQMGWLAEYVTLARLLQPSVVVIEDVDLIARDRETMHDGCAESLLNKLLNEMDGLKEDCEILFILTTNRPQHLEAALASRPGRIDQAIEFPLPDEEGREKLVRLYASGMTLSDAVVRDAVVRTHNVSASFIKELMRRAAQFHLERDDSPVLETIDVKHALDEMVFSGGSLNLRLLGADRWNAPDVE